MGLFLSLLAASAISTPSAAVPVQIVQTSNGFQLLRGGKPYYIKGVGGQTRLAELKSIGGNSIRTWGSDNLDALLDEAHANGLTVTIGIWLGKKEHGFDYRNAEQVKAQYEMAKAAVLKYRNHPALLMWGIGNEMELGEPGDEVWKAIEQIAATVKELDPNHPTMSVVADMWPEKLAAINKYCPSLDALGINSYTGLPRLHQRMEGWKKPYVITEYAFGAPQDGAKAEWGAPIEPTSEEKAGLIRTNYRKNIEGRKQKVLGSYLFVWAPSEASTSAWFHAFLKTGERTATANLLEELFTGKRKRNQAPIVKFKESTPLRITTGTPLPLDVSVSDPEKDRTYVTFEIVSDDPKKRFVGDFERGPELTVMGGRESGLRAPSPPGPYRILAIARDGKGNAGVASRLIFVNEK